MRSVKRIGVLTSGGDAPGMNAAIRAVVRTALDKGWETFGVRDGFAGLMAGSCLQLGARDVGGIIQSAGTLLRTARAPEFMTAGGQERAVEALDRKGLEALVIIGGNGSQAGAHALHKHGVPVVGLASTIDNDLHGADITIGVDTALNVALGTLTTLSEPASSRRTSSSASLRSVLTRSPGARGVLLGATTSTWRPLASHAR